MFRPLLALAFAACAAPSSLQLADDVGGYSAELQRLDAEIAATKARHAGSDWTVEASLAGLYLARARLRGGYEDYHLAEAAINRGFSEAAPGGGPHRAAADVHYSLHRLPQSHAALGAARGQLLLDDRAVADLDLLAADLAWQGGDYDFALDEVDRLEAERPIWRTASTRGIMAVFTEDDLEANRLFDTAESRLVAPAPVVRAWLHLQRGLLDLDRGRNEEALRHYLQADATLPGWWLVHEHVAEVLVLLERREEARTLYLDVVGRTDAPEFMDALAELDLGEGDEDAANLWIEQAGRLYEAQLADFPEAAAGHALDHFLAFGPPERAVALARANVAARPNAEAHGKLAAALLTAGSLDEAEFYLDLALATPWRDAGLRETAEAIARARAAR